MKKTKFVILGLLRDGPLTGYDIKKIIDTQMSFFWQESYGQLYPTLDVLRTEGLISVAADTAAEQSRREKTRFELTEKGRQALRSWFEAENEKISVRNELLLKLFLSASDNAAVIREHLTKLQEHSAEKLALFKEINSQLTRDVVGRTNHEQVLDVLALGIHLHKLYVSWSSALLKKYASAERQT